MLFMGGSGSGKSTTIHYLAGSIMEKKKHEIDPGLIIVTIEPKVIKNKYLN